MPKDRDQSKLWICDVVTPESCPRKWGKWTERICEETSFLFWFFLKLGRRAHHDRFFPTFGIILAQTSLRRQLFKVSNIRNGIHCMKDCDKQRLQTSVSINLWKILAGHTGDWFDVKPASICTTELWDALKSFILTSLKFKVAPYPFYSVAGHLKMAIWSQNDKKGDFLRTSKNWYQCLSLFGIKVHSVKFWSDYCQRHWRCGALKITEQGAFFDLLLWWYAFVDGIHSAPSGPGESTPTILFHRPTFNVLIPQRWL